MSVHSGSVRRQSFGFTVAAAGCLAAAALVGCSTRPATPQTLSGSMPIFTAAAETPQTQDKGGLKVTVVPANYQLQQLYKTEVSRQPSVIPTARPTARVTRTPYLATVPDRLAFQITLYNGLTHVFRSQGAVVQFNAAGKTLATKAADFAELDGAIVPPRNQQTVTIYGPPLSTLPDKTTIGVMLYDVVTATDAAGNPTEKQNFQWFYNYASQAEQRPVDPSAVAATDETTAEPAADVVPPAAAVVNARRRH